MTLYALEAPPPDDDQPAEPPGRAAERAVLGAMLTSAQARDDVLDILTAQDLTFHAHELIWDAIAFLHWDGLPVDQITVADHLESRKALRKAGGASYLAQLVRDLVSTASATYYARIVAEQATRRRLDEVGAKVRSLAATPGNVTDVIAAAQAALTAVAATTPITATPTPGATLDDFLAADPDDEPNWLIPGFLERQDRIIVTAAEGGGKSTLLRQWAIQTALGEHPFTGARITPAKVLLLDLENSERQTRRALRPLRIQASTIDPRNLVIVCKPDGLDLTTPADTAWLDRILTHHKPSLLVTGPLYKLAGGNPNDEVDAKPAALTLDTLRARHDLALIIEAHSRKGENANPKNRPKEPFGWSGWMRWPEFGIHISKDGDVTHWRGMRDDTREFPELLLRGGRWPWMPAQSPDEAKFHQIRQCVQDAGEVLSEAEISRRLDIPRTTLRRILGPRGQQWQAILTRVEIESRGGSVD